MEEQLGAAGLKAKFITAWDIPEIQASEAAGWFKDELLPVGPATSCARKHLAACEELLSGNAPFALILEDDVALYSGFRGGLQAIAAEIMDRKTERFILNIEESMLDYVPASERSPGRWVYPAERGRLAGAYLIDRAAAAFCVREFRANGCGLPIDWFHNHCARAGGLRHYRSHPCLAIQGSLNGRLASLIDHKKASPVRRFSFWLQKSWKRFRASMR